MAKPVNRSEYYDESRDGNGIFTGHLEGLFDQDEDMYGEKYDLGTGRPFNNSYQEFDGLDLNVVEDDENYSCWHIDRNFYELAEGLANAAGLHTQDYEDIA